MPLTPTRKQPLDATLTALAGVTTAADKVIYATGADAFATTDLTSFGRSLIDDASASAARATLGLVIGTDVAAQSSLASYLPLAGGTVAGNLSATGLVKAGTDLIISLGQNTQVTGYVNLATTGDGDLILGSNLRGLGGNANLYVCNSHGSLSGAAIRFPGAGKPRQGSIEFFATPTGAVTAGDAYALTDPRVVITNAGLLGINVNAPSGQLHAKAGTSGTIGSVIQGAASQTAALTEWQDSSASVLASVKADGTFVMCATMRLMGYTVATLPAGVIGDTAYVTDALAPTFLATIVGGGGVTTTVFFNGSNWIVQ